MVIKRFAKSLISITPYRVVRNTEGNRFQAIEACLRQMRTRGYQPGVIVDGGAHLGQFSLEAKSLFPSARFHLIEPQTSCHLALSNLCRVNGFEFHPFALAAENCDLRLNSDDTPSTGAHISDSGSIIEARTLDTLLAGSIAHVDRAMLKLDLQGYELHALRGATRILDVVEVILTEVSFFQQAYEPKIVDLVSFMTSQNYILYDVASLSGRTRDNRLRQGDFIFVKGDSKLLDDGRWS